MEHCPQCGVELHSGSPEGLCEGCLFAGGFSLAENTETKLTMGTVRIATGDPQAALEYDSFGHYQILRVLGEGGMGTVYLAEQTHPIQRRVAIKVIKPGMDTREILSRFAYERQALALMDHPNIARVYDASATEKGRPYFVMEYIDGVPITQYCDAHRLNTRERLELFVQVCQALQHAHSKGVIHRDIKPSNVMVIEQDGHAVPKVIDFGIAKATDQRAVENAAFTKLGQFIGTPEYMSPEQADLVSCDIDTSSDVYSLGVLLYELLVGAVPFDSVTLRKGGMAELLRIIREDEAPALPSKLTGLGKTVTQVAEQRRTDPGSLKRQVAGDLNWIVMKAIEKERQRRYLSVADLAADVNRHLEDQPVLASPPSVVYRTRKFVRRNRTAVLAGVVVHVALIAGLVGILWQARIAGLERAEAVQQRRNAEAQMIRAEAQSRLALAERARAEEQMGVAMREKESADGRLEDVRSLAASMLFEVNDAVKDLSGATPAREIIVHRGLDYLNKMSGQAQGNSELQRQLGAGYLKVSELQYYPGRPSLDDLAGALESSGRSVALLEAQLRAKPRDPELRHFLLQARLRNARLQTVSTERKVQLGRVYQLAAKFAWEQSGDVQAQSDLAEVLLSQGEPQRATDTREKLVAAQPKSVQLRWDLATAQLALGNSLFRKDDQKALELQKKALATFEALSREYPANVQYQRDQAAALTRIGNSYYFFNRFSEAAEVERKGVVIQEQIAAADPRNAGFRHDLTGYREGYAVTLWHLGKSQESMQEFRKAVADSRKLMTEQPGNPLFPVHTAGVLRSMASFASSLGGPKDALPYYREAESLCRKALLEHPDDKMVLQNLAYSVGATAEAVRLSGDPDGAIPIYREAIEEWTRLAQVKSPDEYDVRLLAYAHWALADGLDTLHRLDEAIEEGRIALSVATRLASENPKLEAPQSLVSHFYRHLAGFLSEQSDWTAAIAASLQALPYREKQYAAHPNDENAAIPLWDVYFDLRTSYLKNGEPQRGIEAARRCLEIAEKSLAAAKEDYWRISLRFASLNNLGSTLRLAGHRDESLATYRQAAAELKETPLEKLESKYHQRRIASDLLYIAEGLAGWKEPAEALALCRRILPTVEGLDRNDQDNRTQLFRTYRNMAGYLTNTRDVEGALENYQKALKLNVENAKNADLFWDDSGLLQNKIASLQLRLGKREDAEKSLRSALEMYGRSRHLAQQAVTASEKNLAALGKLGLADCRVAFVSEQLGDLQQSLRSWQAALSNAELLVKSDPNVAYSKTRADIRRSQVVRLQWLLAGDKADYRPILGEDATPRRIREQLAIGWRNMAVDRETVLAPISLRFEAIGKAVALDRELVAEDPQVAVKRSLALDLQESALFHGAQSIHTDGAEQTAELEKQRAALVESRQILNSLRKEGTLPKEDSSVLVTVSNSIEGVEAQLRALQASR